VQIPVVQVEQVEQVVHTGTQVQVWGVHPEKELHEHRFVLQTLSQVQTILHEQEETGTQVQTELQEQVPMLPEGGFSSVDMMYSSLSGIFRLTDLFTVGDWSDLVVPNFGLSSGGLLSPINSEI
jgi:hypothetical protein